MVFLSDTTIIEVPAQARPETLRQVFEQNSGIVIDFHRCQVIYHGYRWFSIAAPQIKITRNCFYENHS